MLRHQNAAAASFTWRDGPHGSQKKRAAAVSNDAESTSTSSNRTRSSRKGVGVDVPVGYHASSSHLFLSDNQESGFRSIVERRDKYCILSHAWTGCEVAHIVPKARDDVSPFLLIHRSVLLSSTSYTKFFIIQRRLSHRTSHPWEYTCLRHCMALLMTMRGRYIGM